MMSSPYTGVYAINPLQDDRWHDLIARHPNASVFHTRGWLRALQTTYGYEPVAFTTSAPSQALQNALLFCIVRSWLTGDRLVSLPFSDHCEPLVENVDQFSALCSFIESLRLKERWKYVEMRSANSLIQFDGGFCSATSFYGHRLDLRPGLVALHKAFHKDCIQRKISRAEREGLTYVAGRSELLLQQFYTLLHMTRFQHHLPAQPFTWIRNLVACMEDDACIRIAYKAGNPVAGILTMNHGKRVVYKYGGSDARFHNLGGVTMLFWKAIQEAKQAGADELDLGRSDKDDAGLIAFKEHWAAERFLLTYWRDPGLIRPELGDGWKVRYAKQLFARLPQGALTLAGKLLYRHIG